MICAYGSSNDWCDASHVASLVTEAMSRLIPEHYQWVTDTKGHDTESESVAGVCSVPLVYCDNANTCEREKKHPVYVLVVEQIGNLFVLYYEKKGVIPWNHFPQQFTITQKDLESMCEQNSNNVVHRVARGLVQDMQLDNMGAPTGYSYGYAQYGNNKSYINVTVPYDIIVPYLLQLKEVVGGEVYTKISGARMRRDGNHYHMTLITPPLLSKARKEALASTGNKYDNPYDKLVGSMVFFQPYGLGTVSKGENTAYYALMNATGDETWNSIVGDLVFPHVTLGFVGQDVHGVAKDASTMIR